MAITDMQMLKFGDGEFGAQSRRRG